MTAAVTLSDVRRRFGHVDALAGLTWQAPSGAVTAVLGPNGAGKTTAIECAVGLRRPDSGTVRVLGTDPAGADADHRARVGIMLQSGGLPNGARPLRLLHHLSRLYAEPAVVGEVAARLGVPDFAGTTVRRLSGGQKQRLALAAALLGRPEVLFLDEPVAGLDPHGRLDVWDHVR
ncbi:MAG: transporter related protein [Humibacillus sp.]|nr:transporter related protein [Humibacillus sp.]